MRRRFEFAAMLLALLVVAGPVAAQGTNRTFPDPLSFAEMTAFLAPLELSAAQVTAAGARHAEYLEAFRALRAGAIARYLDEHGGFSPAFHDDRADIQAAMGKQASILREIAMHESAFFAAIEPLLSDHQRALLPRLAERRERWRLATDPSGQGWRLPPLRRLDLSAAVDALDLSAETHAAIDPLLATYESALTPHFRRIHAARLEVPIQRFDRLRAKRESLAELQSQFDLETPEGKAAYAEAAAAAMHTASPFSLDGADDPEQAAIREGYVRISRLDRRLLSDLRAHLSFEQADELSRRIERRAYARLGIPGDPLHRRVAKYLDDEATAADVREALETLSERYSVDRAPLVARVIERAEENGFSGGAVNVLRLNIDGKPAETEKDSIGEARDAVRDLNAKALQEYAAITGEEVPTRSLPGGVNLVSGDDGVFAFEIDGAGGGGGTFSIAVGPDAEGLEAVGEVQVIVSTTSPEGDGDAMPFQSLIVADHIGIDMIMTDAIEVGDGFEGHAPVLSRPQGWLPQQIGARDIERLGDDLGLDEGERSILQALYADYQASFESLDSGLLGAARKAVQEAGGMFWRGDAGLSRTPAEAYNDVRTAMAAISALDQAFFDDVAVVLERPGIEDAVGRAARTRRREAHLHLGSGMFAGPGSGSREGRVDLVALTATPATRLDAADRGRCIEALAQYDLASEPLFMERWDASLTVAKERAEEIHATMQKGRGGGLVLMGEREADGLLASAARRAAAAEREIHELNQASIAHLVTVLGPNGRSELRTNYEHEAFPEVFRDRAYLDPKLERALGLDLDPAARQALESLCIEYRAAYATLSDRMIARVRAFDEQSAGADAWRPSPEGVQRFEALNRDLEADRFERRDLSERTRQRLADLVGAEEAKKLGLTSADTPGTRGP